MRISFQGIVVAILDTIFFPTESTVIVERESCFSQSSQNSKPFFYIHATLTVTLYINTH
jgi:hypothetical protein